ncbi:hypothetical protein EMCRGX_G013662 [Ephydatia muelleri]
MFFEDFLRLTLTQSDLSNVMEYAVRAALNSSRHTSDRKRTTDTTSEPAIPSPPTLPENKKAPLINVSTSTFLADWKRLVNCEDHSDVIFLLGPKTQLKLLALERLQLGTHAGIDSRDICGGKVAGLKDILYSISGNSGKLATKITLDETLISDVPFLRCLEFLYTSIVELEAKSTFMDETMKAAELFNLPELQTIREKAKNEDEFIPFNLSIGTWLNDRKREIAK